MSIRGNKGSGNVLSRDEWETPQWLFEKLNTQYHFEFDCCASKDNSKCKQFSSFLEFEHLYPIDIRLLQSVCWMNPPFSKARKMFESFFDIVSKGVAIYRCDNMETKLWQEVIFKKATWIFIPNKRISYEGMKGKGAVFPSALIGFGVPSPKDIEGTLLYPK